MTFAQRVKGAMLSVKTEPVCCKKALLYGILLFAPSFSAQKIMLPGLNEALLKQILSLFKTLLGAGFSDAVLTTGKGGKYRLAIKDSGRTEAVLRLFGYASSDAPDQILQGVFCCPDCRNAFLRGVFLSCGNLVSPEKSYHLEFVLPRPTLTAALGAFLAECSLAGKQAERAGHDIIYYKDSEEIIDLLTFTGATGPVFEFVNTKIEREIRNACNRVTNCETANLQKTIASATTQIAAIARIKESGLYDSLSDKLKQTADLRAAYPDASLGELALLHQPPVTKSCAGHRLKKITELAETE